MGIEGVDGDGLGVPGGEQSLQATRRQVIAHQEIRLANDAVAVQRRLVEDVAIVGAQGPLTLTCRRSPSRWNSQRSPSLA